MAYLSHQQPSLKKGSYEKQMERNWSGRIVHFTWSGRSVCAFLQSSQVDQETDGEPATRGKRRARKEVDAGAAGAAAGRYHSEGRLHGLQEFGRLRRRS